MCRGKVRTFLTCHQLPCTLTPVGTGSLKPKMLTKTQLCGREKDIWIDIQTGDPAEIIKYAEELKIHPIYIQDLTQAEHLPKWEFSEESKTYFVIARFLDPGGNSETIPNLTNKLAIFKNDREIITIHKDQIPFIDELKARCEMQKSTITTTFILQCKLLKEVFKTYDGFLIKISGELDYYESKIYKDTKGRPLHPFVKGLFLMRRRVSVLRKVVLLSKTLLDSLREQKRDAPQVQDAIDMFLRIETLVDDLNERTNGLINTHLALSDMRSSEVQKVLTTFAAFFLPLTFVVGVYGMNFDNMPELRHPYGYFITLGVMAVITVVIFYWFKRRGWL